MQDHPQILGALVDDRAPEAKAKDWKASEIASATTLEWKPIDLTKIDVIFTKDQGASSSCVAMTAATMVSRNQYREEGNRIDVSATPFYQQRANLPELGMREDDIRKLMTKVGPSLEILMASYRMSDGQMNEATRTKLDEQIGKILLVAGFFRIDMTVDAIAAIMEGDRKRGMAVPIMLWHHFPINGEWWMNVPAEGRGSGDITGHSVTGVEYGTWNGEKAIVIQESAGVSSTINPGKKNLRIVTESYLKKHLYLAAYTTDLKNDWRDSTPPTDAKPKHTFDVPLNYSDAYIVNPEVAILQDVLKYEGLFKKDADSTGYYGSYTATCVLAFQVKYGIPTDGLEGKRVGPKTLAKLNELYS